MNKSFRILALAAFALMLTGCVTWKPAPAESLKSKGGKYSITLPSGWNVLTLGNRQLASKYGDGLQFFSVAQVNHKNAFGTGKDRTSSTPDMDPRELCDKVVADMKRTPNHDTLEITAVAPFMLGGRAGFRAELASKRTFQADGIRYRHLLFGVASQNGLYLLHYEAPVLHYFAKDLPDIEKSVATFRLL